ncbi:substrate-binding domain-containing protein [Actinacidiphila soli]|uniref:substrate-binding domain-containing protein n=1 Tax=Actinacidiphila soli TaxID=2487275 RepID=UPI001F0C2667|nr:substrate-binding domain-containing protein [Actinacidiphila soli]
MGRHRVPADSTTPEPSGAQRARRRTVGIATALVLTVGAGTFAAMRNGLLSFGGTCGDGTVRLRVAASPDVASPDVAPALSQAAREARSAAVKSDGQCLDVTVTERTASEVSASLGSGSSDGSDFEVWVPDSSAWVDLADAGGSSTPVATIGSVASSPIVVGTVAAQAKQLGWPPKTYTWAALTSAAASSKDLRLGAADPSRSATGLLALAMLNASIARQGSGDTDTRTAGLAKVLAQHSALGDAQIVATLPGDASKDELDNPKRNQALIMSEQAAYQHNTTPGDAPKLDLFFPKDGTADLDYPYTLVDPDDVGTERERAATRASPSTPSPAGSGSSPTQNARSR